MKKTTGTVFIVISIITWLLAIFLGGGFFAASAITGGVKNSTHAENERLKDEYVKTKGRVTEVYDGKTYISYKDDYGDEYEIRINMSSSEFPEGTKVAVYYDEDDPDEAIVPELDEFAYKFLNGSFTVVAIVLFAVFSIPAIIFLILGIKFKKDAKKEALAGRQY